MCRLKVKLRQIVDCGRYRQRSVKYAAYLFVFDPVRPYVSAALPHAVRRFELW